MSEVSITLNMLCDWQSPDGWCDFNGISPEDENVFIKLRDGSLAVVRITDGEPSHVAVMAECSEFAPKNPMKKYSPAWVGAQEECFNELLEVIGFRPEPQIMPTPEFSLEEIELADEIIKRG